MRRLSLIPGDAVGAYRCQYYLALLIVIWPVLLTLQGCTDLGTDPAPASNTNQNSNTPIQQISFVAHVRPILQSYGCISCHGGSGGLTVTTVANLLKGGDHGPAIVAGKPESSPLVIKLSSPPPFGSRMPQGGPYLADSVAQVIRLWITQGAKDN